MSKITGVHVPEAPKNYIINGAFDYWQRGSTAVITGIGNDYLADMVLYNQYGGLSRNYTIAQSSDVPSQSQSGFQSSYSYSVTQNTGVTNTSAAWFYPFEYRMEGYDYAKIHNKAVTISFWMKASVTGLYTVILQSSAGRQYLTTVTQNTSSAWEFKTLTVQLDSSSTGWSFDNTNGLSIIIGPTAGSSYVTSTVNSWGNYGAIFVSGSVEWTATTGATLQIAQFSLVEGTLGFGAKGFQRAGGSIQQELALCQRYCQWNTYCSGDQASNNYGVVGGAGSFSVPMRAAPTIRGTAVLQIQNTNSYSITGIGLNTANYNSTFSFGKYGGVNAYGQGLGVNWVGLNFDAGL